MQDTAPYPQAAEQDPGLYARCSDFFLANNHFDKAVKMLIAGGQYGRALELCVEHDVTISEVRGRGVWRALSGFRWVGMGGFGGFEVRRA